MTNHSDTGAPPPIINNNNAAGAPPAKKKGMSCCTIALIVCACLALPLCGIVIAIIVPAVQMARETALRADARNKAASIAKCYIGYAGTGGEDYREIIAGSDALKGQADSPAKVAEILARGTGFTSARPWYIQNDPKLDFDKVPANILSQVKDGENQLLAAKPIAWAIAINVNISPKKLKTPERLPILWTRGLQADGTWATDSPWQGRGGHIAFADGHVEWCRSVDDLHLEDTAGITIIDLRQLLGPEAIILEDKVP